jgi:hypothetical protein
MLNRDLQKLYKEFTTFYDYYVYGEGMDSEEVAEFFIFKMESSEWFNYLYDKYSEEYIKEFIYEC